MNNYMKFLGIFMGFYDIMLGKRNYPRLSDYSVPAISHTLMDTHFTVRKFVLEKSAMATQAMSRAELAKESDFPHS